MGTPVTTEGLKEILEGVAKVFQAKLEEASTSSGKTIISVPESSHMMQRIELLPNDIKLEGTRNYLSWSRRALLNLRVKGLERYVTGEEIELEIKLDSAGRLWSNTNSLVVSWLLISVSPSIAGMVESINNATDVWNTLAGMYSGAGSVMMMIEVEEKIDATIQGDKTVHQYAAELRSLWADLDHYDPLTLQNPTDVLLGKQYLERRRVARFLKGLNSRFEARRAAMCHLPYLPSLDEAIASMEQEEIRQKVMIGDVTPVVRSALAISNVPSRDDRECYNCGKKGHLSFNCHLQRNYSGNRGGQRGRRGGRGGRGRGGRGVAHLAVVEDSYNATKTSATEMTELEELRKFKLEVENTKGKTQGTQDRDNTTTCFGNFAGFAHVNKEGNEEEDWDWRQA